MSKPCPSCGRPASGRVCSECGASVSARASCASCSASLVPGSRFCNECGTAVPGKRRRTAAAASAPPVPRNWLPWAVAVGAVVVLGALVWYPRTGADAPRGVSLQTQAGSPAAIDLGAMSPREAADRLFDRVMRMAAAGDSADARSFIPMALNAYGQLQELDGDARYHLGVLHLLADDSDAATQQAETLLAEDARHLFGLFVAAQAARDRGSVAEARAFYQRFLDAYASEIARDLPEYQAHAQAFPEMRAEAVAFTTSAR
jgi:hypothetical protein